MTQRRFPVTLALVCLLAAPCLGREGDVKWFRFNKRFITARFTGDLAIGTLTAQRFQQSRVHEIGCSGKDGEVHIGIQDQDLSLKDNERPTSGVRDEDAPGWGIVAELPNAKMADGPARLEALQGSPVTFQGYFRVWNEGHEKDPKPPPSNPNHVFEVHPAWGFSAGNRRFERRDLVRAIPGYSGYGASKFRGLLESLNEEEWLHAFQDNDSLFVALRETSNFFQLPVIIRSVRETAEGHEATVDVFSDAAHENLIFEGLRCITVKGSRIDRRLQEGASTFFLGFFSVNLKKVLEASGGARSENSAVVATEALEFFVFGRPLEQAVSNSKCKPEPEQ